MNVSTVLFLRIFHVFIKYIVLNSFKSEVNMKKSNAKRFSTNSEGIKAKKLVISAIFGSALGILVFLLMLILFAAMAMLISSPHKFLIPFGFFSVYSSAFFAGLFALKRNGSSNALICGGLCGVFFLLVLWGMLTLVSCALPSDSASMPFVLKLLTVPASVIGAFAGMTRGGKKTKKKF